MNLELTISGLCAIAVEADEARPTRPRAVDVLCPSAHCHQARLAWYPAEVVPGRALQGLKPDLVIDPAGVALASLPLDGAALRLEVAPANESFELSWGEERAEAPGSAAEDAWMNWLPPISDLGLAVAESYRLGPPGRLPAGTSARLTLPPGRLRCSRIVHDKDDPTQVMLWRFPATGSVRALANDVVFLAPEIEAAALLLGDEQLFSVEQPGLVRIAISNDLYTVPFDYRAGSETLDHLRHFDAIAGDSRGFAAPEAVDERRTGHPICNGVFLRVQGG
jgi:hypothetical protein